MQQVRPAGTDAIMSTLWVIITLDESSPSHTVHEVCVDEEDGSEGASDSHVALLSTQHRHSLDEHHTQH